MGTSCHGIAKISLGDGQGGEDEEDEVEEAPSAGGGGSCVVAMVRVLLRRSPSRKADGRSKKKNKATESGRKTSSTQLKNCFLVIV